MNVRATEEDASPETRFVRRVGPGSVPLPNDGWMRSPKLKEHAICLDPKHSHYGWLMIEGWDQHWVPCRQLTRNELNEVSLALSKQKLEATRGI